MAFNVSYIFNAQDKFSSVTKKIKKSLGKMNKDVKASGKGMRVMGKDVKVLADKLDNVGTEAKKTKSAMRALGKIAKWAGRRFDSAGRGFRRAFVGGGRLLGGIGGAFMNVSRSVLSGITGWVAAAVAGFGVISGLKVGANFEDAIAGLSAITGVKGDALETFKSEIKGVSVDLITDLDKTADAFARVASAKADVIGTPGAIKEMATAVLTLAKASSGTTVEAASGAVVTALNQWKVGPGMALQFANVVAAGEKFGTSRVAETAAALEKVGPVAAAAGLTFEETNAALQIASKQGLTGEIGGTAFKGLILRSAGEMSKLLGMDVSIETMGLVPLLKLLKERDFNAQQRAQLFGSEIAPFIQALMGSIPELQDMTKAITGTTVAQDQAKTIMETVNQNFKQAGIQFKIKVSEAFDRLKPELDLLIENIGRWIDSITPSDIRAFANGLVSLGMFLKDTAVLIGDEFGPPIRAFIASLTIDSVKKFLVDIKALGTVIGIIADAFTILLSALKGFATWIGELLGALTTGDFSKFTPAAAAFSLKEVVPKSTPFTGEARESGSFKLPGLLGLAQFAIAEQARSVPAVLTSAFGDGAEASTAPTSRADITVEIKAPEGVVQSIQTQRSGDTEAMNLGVNMQSAG